MVKYFLIVYLIIATFTGGVILNDYASCFRSKYTFSEPGGVGAGMSFFYGGLFWPITLTGMVVLYEEKDGRFCLG